MSAFDELMRDLEGEPEAVVLATFDAYQEMEEGNEEPLRDWLQEGEAERAIAEIMAK